jgi:putative membrane protein
MADLLHLLWLTVWLRPYVFAYFALFLLSGRRELGWTRLLLFTPLAFTLAWLSEYSSIHTGLPYGLYRYHPHTVGRELWLAGVPFFDSLSYTFLAYTSLCLALRRLGPRHTLAAATLLGGLFMLLQDVVIDPVAVRGSRWFLGDLFDYPGGGVYFGVPLSNFAGWFLVGSAICAVYLGLERLLALPPPPRPRRHFASGMVLYFAIMGFNAALAFYIGESALGAAGLIVLGAAAAICLRRPAGARP